MVRHMNYAGYSYEPWEDIEPGENCKIFHHVYATNEDGIKVHNRSIPLSPYTHSTMEAFVKWVDCGQPNREQINKLLGTNGNASNEDIIHYYNKWLDNKIDNHLLGVENEYIYSE